jgi:predicted TIM-barrel fold metal-dependent hydrolase
MQRSLLSRRKFVQSSATLALSACAPLSQIGRRPSHVDSHVHIWTSDTQTYPLADGLDPKTEMVPPSFTDQDLLTTCTPEDVHRIILIQMSFYTTDNRYMLDRIASAPASFRGVAILDHTLDPDSIRQEMHRLKPLGVSGFRLYAFTDQIAKWPKLPGIHAMWEEAVLTKQAICLLADPASLPAIEAMCARYPGTKVVIDHFARIGMKDEPTAGHIQSLLRLAKFPLVHIKTSAFYALGRKTPPYTDMEPLISTLCEHFGSHRLMWGSDCPYQLAKGHTYRDSINVFRKHCAFLSQADRNEILHATAVRTFFI